MNFTYLEGLENSTIETNDLMINGLYNNTAPFIGNITGNFTGTVHVIGTQDIIGLQTANLVFNVMIFAVLTAYVIYQISDKRRRL